MNMDTRIEEPSALPSLAVCQRARKSRDPRFDGRFFIAVTSTGIYCRTTCPARMPLEKNVRYFVTAAQAQEQGFRPCLRCRPEAAQRIPEWTLSSETVLRALRHIEAGYLNDQSTGELAQILGLGERQLNRLFQAELGASAKTIAQVCRAKLAKKLLLGSSMSHIDVAYHAGYGSVSRFNSEIKRCFQCTPREIRKGKKAAHTNSIVVKLPVREPYDLEWMFEYLQTRALEGLESVSKTGAEWCYTRQVNSPEPAFVHVRSSAGALTAELPLVDEPLHSLLTRVRRVFDLNADGQTIHESLRSDPLLGRWVKARPGLRVPGAWDGFETAVRAVLGQQVSVARGTVLAGKMIDLYGEGFFPTAAQLVDRDIAEIGMPGKRGQAIRELSEQVVAGLQIDDCQDFDEIQARLEALPGIGPWTANYVRMRALKDPDAFPDNDWVVMKALDATARQAQKAAEVWRPWRAYALMYLWYASPELRQKAQTQKSPTPKNPSQKKSRA